MKRIRNIWTVCCTIFFVLLMLVGILTIVLHIAGFQFLAIQTGSMKQEYDVGTLIVVQNMSADEIETGDIISYVISDNTTVTHRVIGIDYENEYFRTQGDENNTSDANPVFFENLIGRVTGGVPLLGYLVMAVKSKSGIVVVRIVFACMCIYLLQQGIYKIIVKRREKANEEDCELDKTE